MTRDLIKLDLLHKLVDSMALISGNAQMASVIDHPKWSIKHIQAIIDELDNTLTLLQQVAEIFGSESRDTESLLGETNELYH